MFEVEAGTCGLTTGELLSQGGGAFGVAFGACPGGAFLGVSRGTVTPGLSGPTELAATSRACLVISPGGGNFAVAGFCPPGTINACKSGGGGQAGGGGKYTTSSLPSCLSPSSAAGSLRFTGFKLFLASGSSSSTTV